MPRLCQQLLGVMRDCIASKAVLEPTAQPAQAVSLNNLSIFYSRTAQPQRALRCLLQASRL